LREEEEMFYGKNVPGWERVIRVAMGLAIIAGGLIGLPGQLAGYLLMAMGSIGIMTGFIGFCPMCALAGRRLASNQKEKR
jgi:hypothetical protein